MTVVLSGGNHTFYTNAINRRTDTMPDNVTFNAFGNEANPSNYPDTFKGEVGPILMYDRALSQTEVEQIYNSTRNRFI